MTTTQCTRAAAITLTATLIAAALGTGVATASNEAGSRPRTAVVEAMPTGKTFSTPTSRPRGDIQAGISDYKWRFAGIVA